MVTDFFMNRLTCAHCGAECPRALITTRIKDEPGAHGLLVGDRVEITRQDLSFNDSYFPIRPFDPQGELRLLEAWECATCMLVRWAEIVIGADNTIKSIEVVRLDPEALDRATLIATWYLRQDFELWTGHKLWIDARCTKPRPDWFELLRKHVAETPE
jgi:hypothetical protein